MTIADNYEPIKQETNGVTTQFSFDFYALNDDYIKVFLEVDGEQSVIDPTEYEVTFSPNGGLVTFYDPPSGNAYIIITRDTPREQETPFATSSGFPAKTVEGRFDKLTAMVQELQDNVDRSAKVPVGNDVDISLPVPDDGKALVWNGESLVNSDETLQAISDKATGAYTYAQEARGYRDQASASATLAEEWAIKTDAPVDNNEYSAKYHAQAAAASAALSAQYANDKINQTHITNCITEIPQDIKLELYDQGGNIYGRIKSGSKIYFSNGFENDGVTPKFSTKTLTSDYSFGPFSYKTGWVSFIDEGGTVGLSIFTKTETVSERPSSPDTDTLYYNTSTNKTEWKGSYSWLTNISLPLCFTYGTSGYQVFNGFGYIGSTVFALSGVKGLIPNGRNADGTLKNISYSVDSVRTFTQGSYTYSGIVGVDIDGTLMAVSNTDYKYNEKENFNIYTPLNGKMYRFWIADVTYSSGVITSFVPKTAFHALDWNDKTILGPEVYRANGLLLNSSGDTCEGVGTATVYLYQNGIAVIDFNIKITASGTSSSVFTCGLNRNLLVAANSNIPKITPISGGSLTYYATDGHTSSENMEYGGTTTSLVQFWQAARVYDSSGSIGGWPASTYVANQRLIGTVYGTYSK